jgi:hypothetical protein
MFDIVYRLTKIQHLVKARLDQLTTSYGEEEEFLWPCVSLVVHPPKFEKSRNGHTDENLKLEFVAHSIFSVRYLTKGYTSMCSSK